MTGYEMKLLMNKMAEGDPLPKLGATSVTNPLIHWQIINASLQVDLEVLHHQLSSHSIGISAAEESFVTITVSHLLYYNLLKEKCPGVNPCGSHRLSSIQKTARSIQSLQNHCQQP